MRSLTIGVYWVSGFETEDGTEVCVFKNNRNLRTFKNSEREKAVEYFLIKIGECHREVVTDFLLHQTTEKGPTLAGNEFTPI